ILCTTKRELGRDEEDKKKGKRFITGFGYDFVSAKPTAFSLDTPRVCTLAIPMFQQKGAFS
ncbi:hypothetical protein, partial [Syntrophothermus sp.]|uniref:hypothetical protein n=1 Tax=Syntrophothermus sp. TaxID=2736299 RepID=UPI00257B7A7E